MNKKELVKIINKLLDDSFEDLEHSKDHLEEHYACGWIDACNAILKDMGEPTPTDVSTIMEEMKATNPKTNF